MGSCEHCRLFQPGERNDFKDIRVKPTNQVIATIWLQLLSPQTNKGTGANKLVEMILSTCLRFRSILWPLRSFCFIETSKIFNGIIFSDKYALRNNHRVLHRRQMPHYVCRYFSLYENNGDLILTVFSYFKVQNMNITGRTVKP